ncbi:hypothetical protein [Janthinobacterium sp. ZB1P44]|uniref:hypothetical protein n=1 Tax=Janthinobacterium sp. ZB1P44 TaxID=3424192 RepID=UPI003F2855A8
MPMLQVKSVAVQADCSSLGAAKVEIHDLDQKYGEEGREGNTKKAKNIREQIPTRNKAVFIDAT